MHYKGSISSGTSLDIYTDDGFWYDVISAYDSPISAGHRTMLVVYNNTNGNNLRISQSAYDLETSEIYMREGYKYNSSIIWGNWSLVTYPTAMRQYQTLSSLASALGVSMINNKGRFNKGDLDSSININNGIFLAGIADTEFNEGSIYFIRKKTGEGFNNTRLDSGTLYEEESNALGTFTAVKSTIPDGRHWYCWSLQLA